MRLNKKGEESTTPVWWAVIKLVVVALIVVFLFDATKTVTQAITRDSASQGSKESFEELATYKINTLEDAEKKTHEAFQLDKGLRLYGFNRESFIIDLSDGRKVYRPVWERGTEGCNRVGACLCVCDDECDKIRDCRMFDDISYFYAKNLEGNNGAEAAAASYYLALSGEGGIRRLSVERDGDTVYFSGYYSAR